MFSFREFKHSLYIVLLATIILLGLVIPLNQLLPDYFDSWVPDFLVNKSILYYIQEHLDFFLGLIPIIGLMMLIILLWRKK